MVLRFLVGGIIVAVVWIQRHMVVRVMVVRMRVVHMLLLLVWMEVLLLLQRLMLLLLCSRRCGRRRRWRGSTRRWVGQWQWQRQHHRQRLQTSYAVRRVGRVDVAPPQVVVVYVAAAAVVVVHIAAGTTRRSTCPARDIQSVAVGAFVARPPLHVRVCVLEKPMQMPHNNKHECRKIERREGGGETGGG